VSAARRVRIHPAVLGVVALAIGAVIAIVVATRRGPSQQAATPAAPPILAGAIDGTTGASLPQRDVTLLWPSDDATVLVPKPARIYATTSPVDQAKQVVALLLGPPPDADVAAPFPEGTTLQSLFVDPDRTAVVSLSRRAKEGAPGGSAWEMLAVHSLAGSLDQAVPDVDRVKILIEGQEIETLNGHLDLRGPVRFDPSLVQQGR
jgi:spore germination protein GerM